MAAEMIELARNGNLDEMRRLVQTGNVPVDIRCTPDGTTALYWAACNGHLRICDWLIRHGADVRQTTDKSGSTPLHGATDRGHIECVKLLLRSGSDVNRCTTSNGDTALHLAAYRGHLAICRLLLESGACWGIANKQGRTPLEEAQIMSHYDVFQLLCRVRQTQRDQNQRNSNFRSNSCELSPSARAHLREAGSDPVDRKMITEPSVIASTRPQLDLDSQTCSDPTDQQYECDHDRNTTEQCDTNMRYDLKDGANCDENMRYEIKDGSYCDARDDSSRSNSEQTTTGCRVNDINSSNGVSHSSCYCANIVGAHAQDDAHPTSGRTEEMVSKLTRKLNTLENYAETLQLQLAKKDWDLEKQIRKNALLMEQLEKYRSIIKRIQDV